MTDRLELPKTNIRRIMKLNDEVTNISSEAVITTTKAAELFLIAIAEASMKESSTSSKKLVRIDDVFAAIANNQLKYEFLNGAFVDPTVSDQPPKMQIE